MVDRAPQDILKDLAQIMPHLFPAVPVAPEFDRLREEVRAWARSRPDRPGGPTGAGKTSS